MRNNWTRAWLTALSALVLFVIVAHSRELWLLNVEQPVVDFVLDGTDTSIWEQASVLSSLSLIVPGTIVLALVALFLEKRIALVVIVSSIFAYALAGMIGSLVARVSPSSETTGTFPSIEVVQSSVFFGLVVLMFWWVGAPKLLWHIVLELSVVLTLLVSIRGITAGDFWPSDALGGVLVAGLTLITTAIAFEANPAKIPVRKPRKARSAAKSVAVEGTIEV